MPEEVSKDPADGLTLEDIEDRFERDLERFKKNVERAFSERSD